MGRYLCSLVPRPPTRGWRRPLRTALLPDLRAAALDCPAAPSATRPHAGPRGACALRRDGRAAPAAPALRAVGAGRDHRRRHTRKPGAGSGAAQAVPRGGEAEAQEEGKEVEGPGCHSESDTDPLRSRRRGAREGCLPSSPQPEPWPRRGPG